MTPFPAPRPWRKSSYSGDGNNSCVELRDAAPVVGLRDSKDPSGPTLSLTRGALAGLLETARRA